MQEIWKDIEGYEGLYEVSNLGRVRSLDRVVVYSNGRKCLYKGRILKPANNTVGYFFCVLCKNGQKKKKYIHRLVAEAFIPNPDNLPEVNHRDEVKTNNHVENLEWCDGKYNKNYGTCQQRRAEKRSKPVLQLDINTGRVISEYPSLIETGKQTGFSVGNISACCRGICNTAYGFKWQYK